MKITKAEIEHVAILARLNISKEEIERLTEQLDNILTYIAKLNELDTKGIEPTSHATPIPPALREDAVCTSLEQKQALLNAPEEHNGFFEVPKIIE